MDSRAYASAKEFNEDFALMFKNAKQYNAEGSDVYNDAIDLEVSIHNHFRMFLSPVHLYALHGQNERPAIHSTKAHSAGQEEKIVEY